MFRKLTDDLWVSPQITREDIAAAAVQGITLVINNRPEGESADQTDGDTIAAAARSAGLAYVAIPITHAGFSQAQVAAMRDALGGATGPILAYCRSGTRSTLLWGLAEASGGADPAALTRQAAAAGYDLGPVRAMMDMLASGQR